MIERLVWDEVNLRKLLAHGITREEVEDMVSNNGYVFDSPGYPGQVRVVGYTRTNRWLTVAVEPLWHVGPGVWRPITGWASTEREIREYSEDEHL